MKNRIYQIMKKEGLNQKEFSETTGISPATLSSIFNGRTSPTLNHAELLHKRFPKLNMSWLMFGEGEMFVSDEEPRSASRDGVGQDAAGQFAAVGLEGEHLAGADDGSPAFSFPVAGGDPKMPVIREVVKYVDKPQRKITEIRIFFDDGTFQVFPGH
ncbi:MAG: helix-turn-helix transcriptional regulator [Bacteroidaceae bacterium]|nr:helix-turn-helix transcriptional regulator [Bacteroidaceae bacterium]